MTPTETNMRDSLLNTLSLLASEAQLQEFAAKTPYDSFRGEFSCWWFDTFYSKEPSAGRMFSTNELVALSEFSQVFDKNLKALGNEHLTIEELQARAEWRAVLAKAQQTWRQFQGALYPPSAPGRAWSVSPLFTVAVARRWLGTLGCVCASF